MLQYTSLVNLKFFKYHNKKNIIGQVVIERSKHTLKYILSNQKEVLSTPRDRLHNAL